MAHILIYASASLIVTNFAYKYSGRNTLKAQMVGFVLLANEEARELNLLCYNDTLLGIYVILCIYFCCNKMPNTAALMLSLSISIKVGGMLLLPAFLGVVQYQYGILKLFSAVGIIISF